MDFGIRRTKSELDSTGYMEICPGRFSGKHWQEGCVFVWADAFNVAEGIVMKHLPRFDHMSENDVPKAIGSKIVADWMAAARRLPKLSAKEAAEELHLADWFRKKFDDEFRAHGADIVAMLRELAVDCRRFYSQSEWVCIIGV